MPIGIVSDSDFAAELDSLASPIRNKTPTKTDTPEETVEIKDIERGRGKGDVEVPKALRAVLGTHAIESGNKEASVLAERFGISDSSVSAYKTGANSTSSYREPQPDLAERVSNAKLRITSKAQNRLLEAIKQITPEKLADAKLRDLAATAQAMSAVVRNIEPQAQPGNNQNVNFVFFAPKVRPETDYDIITVNE